MALDSDIAALDDVEERIEAIKESLAEVGGEVDAERVFSGEWMSANTDHGSLSAFFAESPRTLSEETDLTTIDDAGFDAYVADNSAFADWDSMIDKAAEDHVEGQFGN